MAISSRGKKFDTLEIEHKGVTVKVTIKVRESLHRPYGDDSDDWKPGLEFFAMDPDYDLDDRDQDVNSLRERITKKIVSQLESSIAWEQFWHVSWKGTAEDLDPEDEEQVANTDSKLEFVLVEIGTLPDGKKIHRRVMPHNKRHWATADCKDGAPETGYKLDWREEKTDTLLALVPATEANTAALERFHEAFKRLYKELYLLLAPERIESSLERLASLCGQALPSLEGAVPSAEIRGRHAGS